MPLVSWRLGTPYISTLDAGPVMNRISTQPKRFDLSSIEHAIRPAHQRSLNDEVYKALAKLIASGEMRSGDRLPAEAELCRLFAVSRPVVRKALTRLRDEGLIVSRKGSGSFVADTGSPTKPKDAESRLAVMLHALEYRRSIEPDAAYYAAIRNGPTDLAAIEEALEDFRRFDDKDARPNVDKAFHRAIAKAGGNEHYEKALDIIGYDIDLGVSLAYHLSKLGQAERRAAIFAEHRSIFEAIKAQDPKAAREAMLTHLERSQVRVIARGQEMMRRSIT